MRCWTASCWPRCIIELTGGRQHGLVLAGAGQAETQFTYRFSGQRVARAVRVDEAALAAHAAFLARIKDAVWAME